MKEFKNILLVSGSGQNCGKTTLVCNIISRLSKKSEVFGLKISPHFHRTGNNQQLVVEGEGFRIFREMDKSSEKDSSRMLSAGAKKVYFIQCADDDLEGVHSHLKKLIPEDLPVICESGSFAEVFKTGKHILVKGLTAENSKKSYLSNLNKADIIIEQSEFSQTQLNYQIEYSDKHWTINYYDHD